MAEHEGKTVNFEDYTINKGSFQDRMSTWMVKNRLLVMSSVGILTLVAIYFAAQVQLQVQLEKMFPMNHPFVQLNQELGSKFGGANTLLVAIRVKDGDIFNTKTLEKIQRITDGIFFRPENIRPLTTSITMMKAKYVRSAGGGTIAIDGVMWPKLPSTPEEVEFAKENIFSNPMYEGNLVSRDGKAALIVAELKDDIDYSAVFAFLQKLRADEQDANTEIFITGRPMLYGWIFSYTNQMFVVFAVSIGAIIVLLWLFFRNSHGVVAPLVVGVFTTILGLAFIGAMGWSLSPLLLVLPFLMASRAISHSVQIAVRYLEEQAVFKDNAIACKRHIEAMMAPNFGACSTDAFGFLVMVLAPIVLMRQTAWEMGVWMLGIYLASGWWHPLFLSLLPNPYVAKSGHAKPVAEWTLGTSFTDRANVALARWVITPVGKTVILAVTGVVFAASLYYSSMIIIGDPSPGSPILYADSQYNTDSATINRVFDRAGSDTYVIFYTGKEDSVTEPPVLLTLQGLGRYLEENMRDVYAGSWSIAAFVTQLNTEFHDGDPRWSLVPTDRPLLGTLVQLASMKMEAQDFARFTDPKFANTNTLYFFKDHTADTVRRAVHFSEEYFAKVGQTLPDLGEFKMASGAVGIEHAVNSVITETHAVIDVAVLFGVFILCVLSFFSIVAGLILTVPLVLANSLAMAYMSLNGIGLSINTLPVAAVGIGLGVDFGIYLLSRYQEEYAKHGDLDQAIIIGAQTAAKAVIFTALTMIVPVALWYWLSDLKFQGEMGILLAILLGANMIAAIVLQPVIVHIIRPKFITGVSTGRVLDQEREFTKAIVSGSR